MLSPSGPHPSFDTKTEIVTTKFEKMFFRALPTELHCYVFISGSSGETRTHDLVLIMNVILPGICYMAISAGFAPTLLTE